MGILLPKNITITDINNKAMEMGVKNYSQKRMVSIISLIQKANFNRFKSKKENGAYIHSDKFNAIAGNYPEYLDILSIYMNLIDIDQSYCASDSLYEDAKPYCKQYFFTPNYTQSLIYQNIETDSSLDKLNKDLDKFYDIYNNYEYYGNNRISIEEMNRLKIFFSFFDFDLDKALEKLDGDYSVWFNNISALKGENHKKKLKKINSKYNWYQSIFYPLGNRIFDNFSRSISNHRFFSPITSLPKPYRNFCSFQGKKLYSIDISNSQPFLSLVLFNPDFWYGENHSSSLLNIDTINLKDYFKCDVIHNYLVSQKNIDIANFQDMVLNDKLYDYLIPQFGLSELPASEARKKVKKVIYKICFGNYEKKYNNLNSGCNKIFIETFPDVFNLFGKIKSWKSQNGPIKLLPFKETESHAMLPLILQRIEAFLMIDVVVKELLNTYPAMPIYTLHDSIVSTEQYLPIIKDTIEKRILEYTGFKPHLKMEAW